MSVLRGGRAPQSVVSVVLRACAGTALLLMAGCASNKAPSYVQGQGAQMAAAQPRKVEMEDDGQPVQPPPVRAMRAEEDDPSQPWSPNYGKGVGAAPPPVAGRLPKQVDAVVRDAVQPVSLRSIAAGGDAPVSTGTLTQLSQSDAALLIAQAINAHEMRRQ